MRGCYDTFTHTDVSVILPTCMNKGRFSLIVVIVVALVSFCVNYRSHVSLLGGGDEGSYIACGKLMSQALEFVYSDQAAEVGKKYLPAKDFVPEAFRVHNADVSPVQVVSGWNKGFSFLSIPFWWIAPDNGWQFVTPIAGAISIVTIYLIGVSVSGPFTGVCAALLLATNWLQLWYSRYPMTEVVSQALILLMALCAVRYYRSQRLVTAVVFSALASLSSFVHFANVPMWLILGAAISSRRSPLDGVDVARVRSLRIREFLGNLSIARDRLGGFIQTALLTIAVPLAATVGYWLLDPGIQRYTRLGKKMANTSGRLSRMLDAVVVRLENLALFIQWPIWILVGIALWLFIRDRGIDRKLWALLGGLALCSFLVIISTGVGTPRVLYVARRNVPIVYPVLFLMSGVALQYVSARWKRLALGKVVASGALIALCATQLKAFAPYSSLNQGKGMPEMASQMRAELQARNDGHPQFVVVPEMSAIFKAGLRYVYGVPVISFSEAITPDVLKTMLNDGIQLYILDDFARKIAPVVKSIPNAELTRISTHIIRWGHANQLGPTAYPRISDRSNLKFYLYKVDLKR